MIPKGAPNYKASYDDGSHASYYVWVDDEGDRGMNIHVHHGEYGEARLSLGELNRLIAALIAARTFMESDQP